MSCVRDKPVIRCRAALKDWMNVCSADKAALRCTAALQEWMNVCCADKADLLSDQSSWCFRLAADNFPASDTPHCRVNSGHWCTAQHFEGGNDLRATMPPHSSSQATVASCRDERKFFGTKEYTELGQELERRRTTFNFSRLCNTVSASTPKSTRQAISSTSACST